MKIEKVLSRGDGANAQVLLVIVSAPEPIGAADDIWVGIGGVEPAEMRASSRWNGVEPCRSLTGDELKSFDLRPLPGQAEYWMARFDFTDHSHVQDSWRYVVSKQDVQTPEKLEIVAWRSTVQHRSPGAAGSVNVFVPLPGIARAQVPGSEVVYQPLFELGVLLVHGIGDHAVRETLVKWTERIVGLWRDRSVEIGRQVLKVVKSDDKRGRIARWARTHQLRNRVPIDGIDEVLTAFDPTPKQEKGQPVFEPPLVRPPTDNPVTCCAAIRAEQTLFADSGGAPTSAALLRVSSIDTQGQLRESHVLFAEAYWTKESFPPAWSELYDWLTVAIPIAVWTRLHRFFWTRRREIAKFAGAAHDPFEWFRVWVSCVAWLVQLAVLPGAYVLLALLLQMVLATFGLLGLLPIPVLRRGVRWVVATLMSTLGQSYAMQSSPIRRSAIVSAVKDKLKWVSDQCHQIVVLSHSQGAEVSRRVFQDARSDTLQGWYTFGSGIAPLATLHTRSLDHPGSRRAVNIGKGVFFAVAAALVVLAIDTVPGVHIGAVEALAGLPSGTWWWLWVAVTLLASAAAILGGRFGPEAKLNMRLSVLPKWHDFFASEDPVPGGSFFDRFGELRDLERQQQRIYNTRVSFLDHTSYWHNIEEFVAPIAMDLLGFLRAGGDKTRETGALEAASRRRDLRTWWNLFVWTVALISAGALAYQVAFGPAQRGTFWFQWATAIGGQASGIWNGLALAFSSGFVGQVLVDLRWPAAILLALGAWSLVNHGLTRWSERALVKDLAEAAMTREEENPKGG